MAKIVGNKKKIAIISVVAVLLVAAIVAAAFVIKDRAGKIDVSLNTITTQSIVETVSATGNVTSGASVEYKVATVATVKEVFVKVGDTVKKGDILATFDTSDFDEQISSLQSSYNDAQKAYNDAVASQKSAQKELASLTTQIASLEKEIESLKSNIEANNQSNTVAVNDITQSLGEIADIAAKYSQDAQSVSNVVTIVSQVISDYQNDAPGIEGTLPEEIVEALNKAVDDGTIKIDSVEKMIDEISTVASKIDLNSVKIDSDSLTELLKKQVELITLTAQQKIVSISAGDTAVKAQSSLMETTKSALDTIKESKQLLAAGWVASIDGVITECSLVSGSQTNLLTTGIKLENMDTMTATITLTEYDVHRVKVGMPATITTAFGSYKGEVATIAPVATGAAGSSILDSIGSIAGISGLSSLTSSGAGVEATVTIYDTDSNIIPGFDADVEITTNEIDNALIVPIESIVLEKTGSYVYKYNPEDETATKTVITTGAVADSGYQVTSGLALGDQIIATPATTYEEDTFKVRVVDKNATK